MSTKSRPSLCCNSHQGHAFCDILFRTQPIHETRCCFGHSSDVIVVGCFFVPPVPQREVLLKTFSASCVPVPKVAHSFRIPSRCSLFGGCNYCLFLDPNLPSVSLGTSDDTAANQLFNCVSNLHRRKQAGSHRFVRDGRTQLFVLPLQSDHLLNFCPFVCSSIFCTNGLNGQFKRQRTNKLVRDTAARLLEALRFIRQVFHAAFILLHFRGNFLGASLL
mmetsp:Transcript_54077/g.161885  ORF Transcript_54077/g.161885 Transcript_54077/m.161885 type:complete len:219 (+) Transcript_54077:346-1002(+)